MPSVGIEPALRDSQSRVLSVERRGQIVSVVSWQTETMISYTVFLKGWQFFRNEQCAEECLQWLAPYLPFGQTVLIFVPLVFEVREG